MCGVLLLLLLLIVCIVWWPMMIRCHEGKVLELDESNFDSAISSFDFIFVDFYAPWCAHCNRLSPELDKAAPILSGLKTPVVIAKIDADKYSRIASKYKIDGFPTLKVFMHGVPTDYNGPRKSDKLVLYLRKFVAPDVTVVESDSGITEFVEAAGTFFPIFIGFGLDESAISNLAIKYKKNAWFAVAKDFSENMMALYDFDKAPALLALHPNFNEQSIFYGPFEDNFLEEFIQQSLLPLTLPMTGDNLKLLKDDKRKIVLTIVEDETDYESKGLIKLLRAAASANRDFVFAYVGYNQWKDFAEAFEVGRKTTLPKMVVWDGNEVFFSVIDSESIDREDQGSQITLFLERYREGKVIEKALGASFVGYLSSLVGMRTVYILVFLVAVMFLIATIGKEESSDASTSVADNRETARLHADKED
ncbi:putative Thioredoxin domain-containing protein [Helianthus annuus]|uniref:Putative PDI-like 5-2 n=1 Tax=Helianthus annuus TaxID=4232 RepID=A0A251VFV6_HELAN|nr:protein disulfide-isomerase 5-2 [Helianthus annuus]KAF5818306.1 putative Thioredoxin domain-containing protein [Helianthus annuus]KAJ0604618.1 putative Thioredoxin domain-containing protein [Helianthus annuus]KAJ0615147.1 putative Thioredoxin domain-containing protein [Helianthus annuus]KAJ0618630.1 putative Thioredoxin domain-containing protein [Helianthus annuus]KAJ0777087.1 putative Thioredoxin domain-containing protein [Helianthus annuus]